jgi:hydrogenase maturation factor/beta-phosphoglucomutase-like phosphatase (HAD superfamily)
LGNIDGIEAMKTKPIRIDAVVFCLEGTLVQRDSHSAAAVRASIGCPADIPVIDFIRNLPETRHRKRVLSTLERLDLASAAASVPVADAAAIVRYLRSKNLRLAIHSRKSLSSSQRVLKKLAPIRLSDFDVIICREELLRHPPGTNSIQLVAQKMNLPVEQMLVVTGDPDSLRTARFAGAISAFYDPFLDAESTGEDYRFHISRLNEIKNIVRLGIPLPTGKLPNDLLREFLNQFVFDDPSILINPGVGEDTAAVDVAPEEVLVLKSDPITFATDSIGQYAVLINANDIATSGARPRWLLTTLLFPYGVTASEIRQVINELKEFCQRWDITLCGGHTEITDAVVRPVVAGMMAGTVARNNLIDKRNMGPGDRILFTKGVAVEGTAIIAREFGDRLKALGMADAEVDSCREFLAEISIIQEAQIAAASKATTAMHDVTEGGLATAVQELSIAGGHRLKIDVDRIPILSETRKIGRLLGINPLGLIGSGSLLICCREDGCETLMSAIRQAGIAVSCIGEVQEKGQGVAAVKNSIPTDWPQFEVDEITQLF